MTDEEIVAALAEAFPHEVNCVGPEDSWCQASAAALTATPNHGRNAT